jgi:transcriptional regulator NrdR family protein
MNEIIVIKRDGTEVPYDKEKIINAVNKAVIEVNGMLDPCWLGRHIA